MEVKDLKGQALLSLGKAREIKSMLQEHTKEQQGDDREK